MDAEDVAHGQGRELNGFAQNIDGCAERAEEVLRDERFVLCGGYLNIR